MRLLKRLITGLFKPVRKNHFGYLLVEILIFGALFAVLSIGLMRTLSISLMSANVVKSILGEQDLKMALSKTLTDFHCKKNLTSIGSVSELKFYKDSTPGTMEGNVLVEIGDFKSALNIVHMEFMDDPVDTTSNTKKFVVYFKRKGAKNLSTKDGNSCISDLGDPNDPGDDNVDKSGCYKQTCSINYEVSGTDVVSCELLDCFGLNSKSPPTNEDMEGILLATACNRYYGFDVGNSKCVYTGPCTQARSSGYHTTNRHLFLRENKDYTLFTGQNWSGGILVGRRPDLTMLSAVGVPVFSGHGGFGRGADVTTNDLSISCSSEYPYSNTAKKCVNDFGGECDKIPYHYRCDEHSGWDVGNSKCVYTGPCYMQKASATRRQFNLRENLTTRPVEMGLGLRPSFSEEAQYGRFTITCSTFRSQLPYLNTFRKCVNDFGGECNKIPYRYRCARDYGWDVGNSKCVYTGSCFFVDKGGLRREFYLRENDTKSNDTARAVFTEPLSRGSTCSSKYPYSKTARKCVNDFGGECKRYLFKMK